MEFMITGRIRETESKRPVPGLFVRAADKDLLYDDILGNATTKPDGTFAIGYEGSDFRELFERKPDIYLVIYGSETAMDPGRPRDRPLFSTRGHVRFNAGRREHFEILIPRESLGNDAPGRVIVTTPGSGAWKEKIDEYHHMHPANYQVDPKRGFSAPYLKCSSNFGPEIRNLKVGDSGWVTVRVSNSGNGVAGTTYVAVYEGPAGYSSPLGDYRINDYRIECVCPGQTVDVKLYWTRLKEIGRIVGICYDPFLDPRGFTVVEQYNRHITSIHYLS